MNRSRHCEVLETIDRIEPSFDTALGQVVDQVSVRSHGPCSRPSRPRERE